ncbi:23S rRNA (adenine2030-N6)-methyltransferase [Albidovulum inexpectatum]|uniref:Ribosomal RNA large subunit methyltransferase J n=1 Tax=Albidovulum inexpectatum TaxID=196587 RepID=A0A2S5JKH6_9RHOB|nr:23S rRNA (adenine(2030)-N(6))-methyltransferase RlmJ [Albidovulum inexpectatum]PPB81765.1 23S rRNA (adenine2030-N6)-methyltransferase [Albidovulum inexpectatum]
MLSYQHLYHAGNPADVHKHAALASILDYLTRKDKPLTYIETHAGRGLYDLSAPEARRTGEAAAGILRLQDRFPPDHPYLRVLRHARAQNGPNAYPGSPLIAAMMLRPEDRLHLAELHPREHAALTRAMAPFRVDLRREDGLRMAVALTPPEPRRGILLIDPSFEIKTEYDTLPRLIARLHKRWNVGIIALWYPILKSGLHKPMLAALESAGLPGTLRHEVGFPPVREGHGMIGSGLFIVNAPFGTDHALARIDQVFAS